VTHPHPDFPGLRREHIEGARLFADRWDLVSSLLVSRPGAVMAEVGVGYGEFSDYLLQQCQPSKLVAIDAFRMHELPERKFWGRPANSVFGDLSHRQYYQQRFQSYGDRVVVEEGMSWEVLGRYPDGFFDFIYVDAAHDYDSVRRDAQAAVKKSKDGGIIVFNDYILFDHINAVPYGVVQNVNELVVNQGWHVIGFALQWNMFCDIAITRAPVLQLQRG
jgi:hypothetical protein